MFEGLEIRTTYGKGSKVISYFKDGVIVGRRCTECGEDLEISCFTIEKKRLGTYKSKCKKCRSKRQSYISDTEILGITGVEVRVTGTNSKSISYFKDGVMIGKKCNKCGEDLEISYFADKRATCKKCKKLKNMKIKEINKINIFGVEGVEVRQTHGKTSGFVYYKDNIVIGRRCNKCGRDLEINCFCHSSGASGGYHPHCKDCRKEEKKQYYKENFEEINNKNKERQKNDPEGTRIRQQRYRARHFEKIQKRNKDKKERKKQENIAEITNMLEQINPRFKEIGLPIYGIIYKVTNVKTKHTYTGQTKLGLSLRYGSNIIKSWIAERKEKTNQKFIDELIEENLTIEIIDVGCCQYHLDKLEVYWINYYDSYNNGYNNNAGYHDTDDGKGEFEQILAHNNLQFIDGKLTEKVM